MFKGLARVSTSGALYYLVAFSKNTPFVRKARRNWLMYDKVYDHYFTETEVTKTYGKYFAIIRKKEENLTQKDGPTFRFWKIILKKDGRAS